MIKKLLLIFHTLKYVKPIQIKYQIWYRIKNKFLQINWYKKYDQFETNLLKIENYYSLVLSSNKYIGQNHFEFLNLGFQFENRINWNFNDYGKLWNYNLQYFDYLLDDSILLEDRIDLLKDFSDQLLKNRIKLEPYPTSLRIINSILFISKNSIENALIQKALKRQINYLENNLEYHLLANHLLENIFTLFISSFYLKDEILFNRTNRLLIEQLQEQILNDGGHYECSPMYHSIILSKLFLCIEISSSHKYFNNDVNELKPIASKMLSWIKAYSFSDGSWALMNDAALGIAPTTNQLLEVSKKLNIEVSKIALKDSGYRKLENKHFEVLIDVGNIIPKFQPGHAHSDMLSFCLWYKGEQVIVDKGISTYEPNAQRQIERYTLSHNTITINEQNQSEVWKGFRIGKRAKVEIKKEILNEIIAEHDGYKNFNLIHERKFKIENNKFIIHDKIKGKMDQNTKAYSNLNFNYQLNPVLKSNELEFDNINISVTNFDSLFLIDSTISNSFNKLFKSKCLHTKFTNDNEIQFVFN